MRLLRLMLLILAALVSSSGAQAAEETIVVADFKDWIAPKGMPHGWDLKVRTGGASYEVTRDGGFTALRLKSVNNSYSIQGMVKVDVKRFPMLSWRWKAVKLPEGGDFRKSETDDQAAQLFVAFSKTKAIVYIWDTTAPVGATADTSPVPLMHVHVIVVRSGSAELGKWVTETRNVYEDYQRLFGGEPPAELGMRFQINSQHTGTSSESMFADVVFRKQ